MDISFELYKVFYYVAVTLSFSEASRHLFISQSAVSQSIKSLEQKLGHPLFVRNTKKVSLTPEGESLLRHVEPAVNLLYEGENQIRNSPSLKAPLRIGASDTICRYFLVPFFKRFHREFPDIRIRVINATSGGCVSLLQNNRVDFIVANYPNPGLTQKDSFFVIQEFQDIFVAGKSILIWKVKHFLFPSLPVILFSCWKRTVPQTSLYTSFLQNTVCPFLLKQSFPAMTCCWTWRESGWGSLWSRTMCWNTAAKTSTVSEYGRTFPKES